MRTYDKDDFISKNHYLWKEHPPYSTDYDQGLTFMYRQILKVLAQKAKF